MIKNCANSGHIFQNKLRNTWTVILKISKALQIHFLLLCRTKDKNKTKTYELKVMLVICMGNNYILIAVWYGVELIFNQKWKTDLQAGTS